MSEARLNAFGLLLSFFLKLNQKLRLVENKVYAATGETPVESSASSYFIILFSNCSASFVSESWQKSLQLTKKKVVTYDTN